jgi:lipoprotein-anchoring transpeptidase ErfK/SrfK
MTTVRVTMLNAQTGDTQVIQRNVIGGPAQHTYTATVTPPKGTYGVGVIPEVEFSKSVPVSSRAELASHLSVTSTPTAVAGGWRWISDTTVAWRPTSGFWPARQTVTVKADIANVRINGTKSDSGYSWGSGNSSSTFKVGRAMIINLNGKTDQGYATVDGKTVRKFGTSLGKPGYETRSGIKTILERYEVTRMTNVGVTNDSVYDLQVPYAMRMTTSGEFLHAAPWDGEIGYANTSHGCSHLTMSDAYYFYQKALEYDPVITKGTGRQMETDNGRGALWNVPAAKWVNYTTTKPTA